MISTNGSAGAPVKANGLAMTDVSTPSFSAQGKRAWSNPLLAVARLTAMLILTIIVYTAYRVSRLRASDPAQRHQLNARWTQRWCRGLLKLGGIRLRTVGTSPTPGTLLAPNHVTSADILAIASSTPCFFVSRDDVGRWPLIGPLTRSTGQLLHKRVSSSRALLDTAREIGERLKSHASVCVFLEGTTTQGDRLLPFKPSLVQAAIDANAAVTPIGVRWHTTRPGQTVVDDVSFWRDDQSFGEHAWRMLGLRGIEVELRFGEPIPAAGKDRKALAHLTGERVAALTHLPAPAPYTGAKQAKEITG